MWQWDDAGSPASRTVIWVVTTSTLLALSHFTSPGIFFTEHPFFFIFFFLTAADQMHFTCSCAGCWVHFTGWWADTLWHTPTQLPTGIGSSSESCHSQSEAANKLFSLLCCSSVVKMPSWSHAFLPPATSVLLPFPGCSYPSLGAIWGNTMG